MTRHERNIVNMCDTVIGVYTENETVFANYPAIVECENNLVTTVGEIKEVDKQYLSATNGKTAEKNSAVDETIAAAVPIKAALYAYAVKNNLQDFKAKVSYSESDLKKLTVPELITRCKIFVEEGRANLGNLGAYLMTEEKIAALEARINKVGIKSGEKGSSFANKSSLRKTLTQKLGKVSEIFNEEYDELIELVRDDHKDLYEQYFAARVIRDLGGSHGNGGDDSAANPPAAPAT